MHSRGRFLGELGLLTGEGSYYSAVALDAGEVLAVPAGRLGEMPFAVELADIDLAPRGGLRGPGVTEMGVVRPHHDLRADRGRTGARGRAKQVTHLLVGRLGEVPVGLPDREERRRRRRTDHLTQGDRQSLAVR